MANQLKAVIFLELALFYNLHFLCKCFTHNTYLAIYQYLFPHAHPLEGERVFKGQELGQLLWHANEKQTLIKNTSLSDSLYLVGL